MKSEERHKLKSNELADSLKELSEFFNRHSSKLLAGVIAILVLAAAVLWTQKNEAASQYERISLLQNLIAQSNQLQYRAAQQARVQPEEKTTEEFLYNVEPQAGLLAELAQMETGSPVGITALLQQAQNLRSQLLYSDKAMSEQEQLDLNRRTEIIYQRVISECPKQAVVAATARFGLALLAEDRGQWDQAKQIYETITDDKEGQLAGTTLPFHAQKRLNLLDGINQPIVFPEAPLETVTETPAEMPTEAAQVEVPAKAPAEAPAKDSPKEERGKK
ncbi:MAG: hypothetical protein KAJ52_02595 [Sedimentisphaerales bacterium]|nr:hypothetical protein [Sedimentisphaerales bacterium]